MLHTISGGAKKIEERRLVLAAQAGDQHAFDILYQRYASRVYAFARQLSHSQSDAEDLTQDAFIGAFQSMNRFHGRSALLTWLLGIVVRRWRDHSRRTTLALGNREPDYGNGFCDQTIANIVFYDALAALPTPLNEAFLLVAVQGLTHREAAEILQQPVGTIKWRVAEAGRRLRTLLRDDETPRPEKKESLDVLQSHK